MTLKLPKMKVKPSQEIVLIPGIQIQEVLQPLKQEVLEPLKAESYWTAQKPKTKLSTSLQELNAKNLSSNAEDLETYKLLRKSYLDLIAELERKAGHDKTAVDSITKLNKSILDVANEIRRLESYAEQANILVNIGKRHFEGIFRALIRSLQVIVESMQGKLKKPEHDKLIKAIDEAMKELAAQMSVFTKDFEVDIRKQFEEL